MSHKFYKTSNPLKYECHHDIEWVGTQQRALEYTLKYLLKGMIYIRRLYNVQSTMFDFIAGHDMAYVQVYRVRQKSAYPPPTPYKCIILKIYPMRF